MNRLDRRLLSGAAAVAAAVALLAPSAAFAAGGPPAGHGHGRGGGVGGGRANGGGGGETTAANNLSVPAVFVPGTAGAPTLNFPCGAPANPTGTPMTGFEISPGSFYYVQGLHTWQASCAEAPDNTVTVTAGWGDNLTGQAALKTGSPIRVEVGLFDEAAANLGMTGYNVDKLEPSKLDRESLYGTLAASGETDAPPAAISTPYINPATGLAEVRVWDAGATLKIYPEGSPDSPVFSGPATAEINATGRVVYGYNLRVQTPGKYVIEFHAPTVTISSALPGTVIDGHTASLTITVVSGGGRGGGH